LTDANCSSNTINKHCSTSGTQTCVQCNIDGDCPLLGQTCSEGVCVV
jgi:hypothetical protein